MANSVDLIAVRVLTIELINIKFALQALRKNSNKAPCNHMIQLLNTEAYIENRIQEIGCV